MNRQSLTARSDAPPKIDSAPTVGLAWLVRLRWGFAAAETLIALGAPYYGLKGQALPAVLAIATSLATNLGLRAWSRRPEPASQLLLASVLVLDGFLLTVVLHATGGAMNPFSVLYLVHVALAALVLDVRATWVVAAVTCLDFASLFVDGGASSSSMPAGHHAHHMGHGAAGAAADGIGMHLRGMLIGYAVAAGFVGYFVFRVARALERREREMLALRDWAARTEKLASLSALAAGAAHELGTPLGTIAVAAKELERNAATDGALRRETVIDDVRLIREEAERCRQIIAKLATNAGESQGGPPRRTSIGAIVDRVKGSLSDARAASLTVDAPPADAFVWAPDELLVQVLTTLVKNGLEAAASAPDPGRVRLSTTVEGERVAFHVEDAGAGMSEETLRRLGEPFFSTKNGRGMGLGLFLARSFADRVGGSLEVASQPGKGSLFVLQVPGGHT